MKLEKFDLEKAIYGAQVITRGGDEVTQLSKFEGVSEYPLVGVLKGRVNAWTINGCHVIGDKCNEDLFIVGEVQSIWVNVYRKCWDGEIFIGNNRYKSHEDAIEDVKENDPDYIKTIEITDEP